MFIFRWEDETWQERKKERHRESKERMGEGREDGKRTSH